MILETGRICLKIAGREAGKYCVIVKPIDSGFVMISGPKNITGIKRRKCNVFHIEPTNEKLNVSEDAEDSALENAWKASGLIEKLKIELPKKRTREKKPERRNN